MSKTVLITGASSGFGLATAKLFQEHGWNVMATMRTPDKGADLARLPGVLVAAADVVDRPSIAAAVAAATERFGGIDVLVNNAGYGTLGVLEAATEAEINKQFDVNVFGLMAVTQAVLPVMRRQRAGTLINISSVGGRLAFPYFSLYHATKFAVEGLSESLQYELAPLGIRVKLVEPGGYKTNFAGSSLGFFGVEGLEDYRAGFDRFLQTMAQGAGQNENIAEVAAKIYEAATDPTDRLRYPVGADALQLLEAQRTLGEVPFHRMLVQQMGLV